MEEKDNDSLLYFLNENNTQQSTEPIINNNHLSCIDVNFNEPIQSEILSVKNAIHFCDEDEEVDDITSLLRIIEMSIQINIPERSEYSEIMNILSQKSNHCPLSRNSLKFYNSKAKTISLAGKVLFNSKSTAQSSIMTMTNQPKSQYRLNDKLQYKDSRI